MTTSKQKQAPQTSADLVKLYTAERAGYHVALGELAKANEGARMVREAVETAGEPLIESLAYKAALSVIEVCKDLVAARRRDALSLARRARTAHQVEFCQANNRVDLENFPRLELPDLDKKDA